MITPASLLGLQSPHSLTVTFSQKSIIVSFMTQFAEAFYHSFNLLHEVVPEECKYGFKFDKPFEPLKGNTQLDMDCSLLPEDAQLG